MTSSKPLLTQVEARKLAGRQWNIAGESYRFADYDPAEPGQPPWKSGAEGLAFPLLGNDGQIAAYVKTFNEIHPDAKRARRTEWLISQRLHELTPELRAAPCRWLDTAFDSRPAQISFDFACSFAVAVPGQTWLETRVDVTDGIKTLNSRFRERCVQSLLIALAELERRDIVHGDLSPNNIIVNLNAPADEPALWLIDFDGFAATGAGSGLDRLSVGEGGTVGTHGYCPPELYRKHAHGDGSAAPFSDRFGRDMLLLELLCFDRQCDYEEPVCNWPLDQLRPRLQASPLARRLPHLAAPDALNQEESRRPSSQELAQSLNLASTSPTPVRSAAIQSKCPASSSPQTSLSATLARTVFLSLWLSCLTVLALLCFTVTRLIVHGFGKDEGILSGAAQLLCAVGAFVGLATPLTFRAFASARPMAVNVVGIWFRIPARKNLWRTDLQHRLQMAGLLTGLLGVMTPCLLYLLA